MKTHSYIPRPAKIVERRILSDDVVGLRVKLTDRKPFVFHPGQFVMLSVFGFGEVPVAITTSPDEKSYLEVAVRSVGVVTQKIFSLSVGDAVGISGPYGNGFSLSKIKGRDLVLISGGLGLVPLRSLIRHLGSRKNFANSITLLNGAREEEGLLYQDEYEGWSKFAKVNLTVDRCGPNWDGCTGQITKLFDREPVKRGSVMIVCGPPAMFPEVIKRYAGKSIAEGDLYFMLERKMKCGVGKCQHCTCGELYVCLDGPVFSYEQLKYNKEAFA